MELKNSSAWQHEERKKRWRDICAELPGHFSCSQSSGEQKLPRTRLLDLRVPYLLALRESIAAGVGFVLQESPTPRHFTSLCVKSVALLTSRL